ncbi:MAG TPA: UvrD-helicase domain-containing protein [Anaerolineales bacterium]|nr:UvrD-helicase domain-containing protein [Anaerolineales bacterium]
MDLLTDLNPQQRMAVTAELGPVLVLAGPGSGKTRVLTHRVAYLLGHFAAQPRQIVAVTFTNKAAREMQGRVRTLLDDPRLAAQVNLGTFHALCARFLRRDGERLGLAPTFVIFDDSDQESLARQALKQNHLDPRQHTPARLLNAISAAKNELVPADAYPVTSAFGEIVARVYPRYEELLRENNALDFDDLLVWTVRLLRDHDDLRSAYRRRFRHLLVDEFQDTNTVQYELLRLLEPEGGDLFAVGDPDQSIYRWRGADYRNVQRFQKDYPAHRLILLEQSYRSTQVVLDAAMGVIDRQPGRTRKRLFTDRGQGEAIVFHEAYDEDDEAAFVLDTIALLARAGVEPRGCAVMYRTNAQSRALEEAFLRANLPYRLVGAQRFYGRREVKDLIAYLRLIHNPSDEVSLLRVLNTPPRGIGAKTAEALLAAARQAGVGVGPYLMGIALGQAQPPPDLAPRAAAAAAAFGAQLESWRRLAAAAPLPLLFDRVVEDTGYRRYLDDGSDEGVDRWENVLELRGLAMAEEETDEGPATAELNLAGFLEQVALVSDQDTLTEDMNAPVLLTLHAAKGLEFPAVFIVGLDEGLLPHYRSLDDSEAMAEERRLLYVGITRTRDRLFLLRAFRRHSFGTGGVCEPSRFLEDLPADRLEGVAEPTRARAAYDRQTRWEPSSAPPPEPRFQAGMRVAHAAFGDGVVLESELDREDEIVTIQFPAGVKRLAASLAPLNILVDSDRGGRPPGRGVS